MRNALHEDLEQQLIAAREQCQKAEADAAEIVRGYEDVIGLLRRELANREAHSQPRQEHDCKRCGKLERIAVVEFCLLLTVIYLICGGQHMFEDRPTLHFICSFCTYAPLLLLYFRNKWRKFKRRFAWESPKDNDIYRSLQERWNLAINRLRME